MGSAWTQTDDGPKIGREGARMESGTARTPAGDIASCLLPEDGWERGEDTERTEVRVQWMQRSDDEVKVRI